MEHAQYGAAGERRSAGSRPETTRKGSSNVSTTASPLVNDDDLPPSRIPTRPRSKSQLAPRPVLPHQSSAEFQPPLPASRIPRPSSSRRGSSNALENAEGRGTRTERDMYGHRQRATRTASPELGGRIVEGLVKNELPPFLYHPDDALRIAEQGHDLWSDDEDDVAGYEGARGGREGQNPLSRSVGGMEEREGKRKRNDTIKPERTTRPDDRQDGMGSSDYMHPAVDRDLEMHSTPRKQGGNNLGLGIPTSSALRKQATSRSASTRTPAAHNTSTPRSASLNLLASASNMPSSSPSSSRLGVAAHFVPPENTYTPPKNANWDEVVLPTVAKKLGMVESDKSRQGDDGDLAIEWDKDGTPIKWAKREMLSTSQSTNVSVTPDTGEDMVGAQKLTLQYAGTSGPGVASSPSSFSPTFEPSPNNPLRYSAQSVRQKKSGESIELSPMPTPIRTSRGQATALYTEPPVSPAPFSDLTPVPPGWRGDLPAQGDNQERITRKPSLLRRLTSQASQRSLRSQAGAQGTFGPASMPSSPSRAPSSYDVTRDAGVGYGRGQGQRQGNFQGQEHDQAPDQGQNLQYGQNQAWAGGMENGKQFDTGRPTGLHPSNRTASGQQVQRLGQNQSQNQGLGSSQGHRQGQGQGQGQGGHVQQGAKGQVGPQAGSKKDETVGKGCGCVVM